jgi:hypothetical protein
MPMMALGTVARGTLRTVRIDTLRAGIVHPPPLQGIVDRLGLRRRSPTRIGLEARPAQQVRQLARTHWNDRASAGVVEINVNRAHAVFARWPAALREQRRQLLRAQLEAVPLACRQTQRDGLEGIGWVVRHTCLRRASQPVYNLGREGIVK